MCLNNLVLTGFSSLGHPCGTSQSPSDCVPPSISTTTPFKHRTIIYILPLILHARYSQFAMGTIEWGFRSDLLASRGKPNELLFNDWFLSCTLFSCCRYRPRRQQKAHPCKRCGSSLFKCCCGRQFKRCTRLKAWELSSNKLFSPRSCWQTPAMVHQLVERVSIRQGLVLGVLENNCIRCCLQL